MKRPVPCEIFPHNFGLVFVPGNNPPPVWISVQHDGMPETIFTGLFQTRETPSKRDLHTLQLALEIFRAASPRVGLVYGMYDRHFLETNVAVSLAFNDPRLGPCYKAFHSELSAQIEKSSALHGPCLLLDIHGFADQPDFCVPDGGYDAIFGTANRRTVLNKGITLEDKTDHLDRKLRDILSERGLAIFCPEGEPIRERLWRERMEIEQPHKTWFMRGSLTDADIDETASDLSYPPSLPDPYNGGFLVRHHAESNTKLAAAIQIELSYEARKPDVEGMPNAKRAAFVAGVSDLIQKIYP